ncbi:MAG: inositol monophosphatase family protein [Chitinophagales bacterium]
MSLEKICSQAIDVIKEVGQYIRHERRKLQSIHIESKGIRDFVTEVDKTSEQALAEKLHSIFPEAGFITEEKTVAQTEKEFRWVIDPLDGTMNYIHGIPIYSISVALMHHHEIILGIVYEINNDEVFFTWKGTVSYMNGNAIHISTCRKIQDALIVTGFPYTRTDRIEGITKTLAYFLEHCRDIRRIGSAAVDLCYVACGRIDAYYEGYLNIWDIAAGILIVKNAGGVATDFDGREDYASGNILACNKTLHPEIMKGISFDV